MAVEKKHKISECTRQSVDLARAKLLGRRIHFGGCVYEIIGVSNHKAVSVVFLHDLEDEEESTKWVYLQDIAHLLL